MRSTFKILFYINRSKVRQDGHTAILCRITVDGASTVMSTGEECTPEEWNVKQSETSDRKLNLRLQMFKEKIEQAYVETLRRDGVVSAELLKNHLQRTNSVPTMLLEASRTELQSIEACIGKSKSPNTYRNNFYCDRELSRFIRSKRETDIPIPTLNIAFFDEYRFHLKKEGYAPATINMHLCWLSRLMYKAVSRRVIRFNPFEGAKYETEEHSPRFLQKSDIARLLAFPVQHEEVELCRRMFLFSVFTGLAFADMQSLRASHIEMNGEGRRYIRKTRLKTEVESLIPLHPIAEQILALYMKDRDNESDYVIFPDHVSVGKLKNRLKAVGLACGIRQPLTWHVARHSFGTMTLEAGIPMESIARMMGHSSISSTQIYAQITDQKISRDMDRLMTNISSLYYVKQS